MPEPYIYRDASLTLDGSELKCYYNRVRLIPTDKMADAESTCAPGLEIPSSTTWIAEIDALASFTDGVDVGLWNLLFPLAKTRQTFVLLPEDGVAVGPGNPEATFDAYVPSIPFLDHTLGESARMTITFPVIGEPAFATA